MTKLKNLIINNDIKNILLYVVNNEFNNRKTIDDKFSYYSKSYYGNMFNFLHIINNMLNNGENVKVILEDSKNFFSFFSDEFQKIDFFRYDISNFTGYIRELLCLFYYLRYKEFSNNTENKLYDKNNILTKNIYLTDLINSFNSEKKNILIDQLVESFNFLDDFNKIFSFDKNKGLIMNILSKYIAKKFTTGGDPKLETIAIELFLSEKYNLIKNKRPNRTNVKRSIDFLSKLSNKKRKTKYISDKLNFKNSEFLKDDQDLDEDNSDSCSDNSNELDVKNSEFSKDNQDLDENNLESSNNRLNLYLFDDEIKKLISENINRNNLIKELMDQIKELKNEIDIINLDIEKIKK